MASLNSCNAAMACFGFNLGTCKASQPGGKCGKGLHKCLKKLSSGNVCGGAHSFMECTAQ